MRPLSRYHGQVQGVGACPCNGPCCLPRHGRDCIVPTLQMRKLKPRGTGGLPGSLSCLCASLLLGLRVPQNVRSSEREGVRMGSWALFLLSLSSGGRHLQTWGPTPRLHLLPPPHEDLRVMGPALSAARRPPASWGSFPPASTPLKVLWSPSSSGLERHPLWG